MKPWMALLLAVATGGTGAQEYRQQYAERWPLSLSSAQSGAYRIVIEAQVYERAVSPQLADLQVFNAAGQALPSALLSPDQPLAQAPVQRELPWFVLPAQHGGAGDDLTLIAQRDSDGRVQRLSARSGRARDDSRAGGWLVDASVLGAQPLAALNLDWGDTGQPLQMDVRVESSDDLRSWNVVSAQVPLVDLQREGKRLLQPRLDIGRNARYLRVLPLRGAALPTLRGVLAELPAVEATHPWEWLGLRPVHQQDGSFTFELEGRFPIGLVDVANSDNSLVQWTLYSRDSSAQDWQRRTAPWIAYQVRADSRGATHSAAQRLAGPTRDRYWKLVAEPAAQGGEPTLRLAYQPEVMVFLSQGAAPYALAVGSATAARRDAPVAVLIDELRQRNGPSWQPTLARLEGAPETLAGEAALSTPVDWKRWLLWGLLGIGVLAVLALAVSVLRRGPLERQD